MTSQLVFHHLACLVADMDAALAEYEKILPGKCGTQTLIQEQDVFVAFVELRPSVFLELVQPCSEVSPLARMMKKGINFYHIAFQVENIKQAIAELEALGYRHLHQFHSEAFGGHICAFVVSPESHLMELIEL